ncbi:MAG: electron transfer flavoprotein subunit beta/FixA family protein [Planctomycetes bacterium]|nr:electron transfer flavoprotein subunit beta/FixA family protein [Planctomycetota bacterium]
MRIAACLKRVPDTATKIRIAADGKTIDTADVQYIISPYDEFAVEEAIRAKEKLGAGEVFVLTLGPEAANQNLRQALAMGADSAILIRHDGARLDALQTAKNLAAALQELQPEIVLFGRASVDAQRGQVGPMTARLLGIPCITEIVKLTVAAGSACAEREVEGSREVVEVSLPAAFTAQKGLNEPRYPSLKGIMAAKKKPLREVAAREFPATAEVVSLTPPPARKAGRIVGEGVAAVPELVRLLRAEAKVI